ncbi:MAG: 4-hydroxy-tetrahydrodipicolinate synthase [Ruminococcaceae bacterium]|nr:4-hydroxy-tetrahydrodipicolinate synthase [Oscillospiraceae bacterium]
MDTYKMKKSLFEGVASALATPFSAGEIDYSAFRRICDWQINMGVDALVVSGTTGEAATLARTERRILAETAMDVAAQRVPVVVGCGSSDTATAVSLCKEAVSIGADALLVITPYCNKGTRRGLIEHYKRVADAAGGISVILYNVPSRTGVDMSLEQYKELSKIENIVAVKEAATSLTKMTRLAGESSLTLYSGNDDMILPVISVGGRGVISVLSNLVPAAVSAMTHAALDGDFKTAFPIAHTYAHLIELLFAETNPAPLKYAMSLLELCSGEMRLPMWDISDELKVKIKDEMVRLNLI